MLSRHDHRMLLLVRCACDRSNKETPARGPAAHPAGRRVYLDRILELRLCRSESKQFPDMPPCVFYYAGQYVMVNSYACRTNQVWRRGRRSRRGLSWGSAATGATSRPPPCESATRGRADVPTPCVPVLRTRRVDTGTERLLVIPPRRDNTRRAAKQIFFENPWKMMT